MLKKLIGTALCAMLMIGTASAATWPAWAGSALQWAERNGVSETFTEQPLMQVTRGHAPQLLYEAAGSPAVSAETQFTDVPAHYADAVTWAAERGIVKGVGDGRYLPDRPVSRQEFAAMLYRSAGAPGVDADMLSGFADRAAVSDWAQDAMCWCVDNGLMQGKAEKRLAPQDTIIVAEAVLMLRRADTGDTTGDVLTVFDLSEVKEALRQAMLRAGQPPLFDCSRLAEIAYLEMDVRNLYYALLHEQPELKYAYDLDITLAGDGYLRCIFGYMPYYTGAYPDEFEGIAVSGLQQLIQTARDHMGASEPVKIRITDRSLTVDDMNKALQQVGGSYFYCGLNRDGTAITYTPQNNMSREACMARLAEIDRLADQICAETVTPDMTEAEKAEALYTWLTEHVKYDHRYYSDRVNLPYDAMTAYGALHDQLAICGGYAQALQVLFEKAGIPCYTVSGKLGAESHMWNIAQTAGQWRWYDATSDRGRADYWFNYFGVDAQAMTRHTWDAGWIERLTGASA